MGQVSSNGGSGASHGGRGGRGYGHMQALLPYGTIFVESTWGSGGGSHTINGNTGGRGGGFVHMYATMGIDIGGSVSANGKNPSVRQCLSNIYRITARKSLLNNFQR
jgi:hypothetical protein